MENPAKNPSGRSSADRRSMASSDEGLSRPFGSSLHSQIAGELGLGDTIVAQSPAKQQPSGTCSVFDYYESKFGDGSRIRDKIHEESVVTIEIKTNREVEHNLVCRAKLMRELTKLFDYRPIVLCVNDKSKIAFGMISDEPAYLVTVTALASVMAPRCNHRFTSVIQEELHNELRIPANRGIVKFEPMPEEDLGTNGMTYWQKIENGGGKVNSAFGGPTRATSKSSRLGSIFGRFTPRSKASSRSRGSLRQGTSTEVADGGPDGEPKPNIGLD
ncbi:hypothetical protein FQN49_004179 [Arthroderma sp. PD_2]|nr:hypothetical protein FQN49_004179 [Arthroderma sp. PD_2]